MNKIDYQIGLTILSIIGASISIVLLINNKYKILNNAFINDGEEYKINLYNRILLVLVFIGFLIINYNEYIEALNSGKNTDAYVLQIYSSVLVDTSLPASL